MNELEKLIKEREALDVKIFILENQSGEEFDYSIYVDKYFDYLNEVMWVKHWTGGKYDSSYSYFEVVSVSDNSITREYRELWFLTMEEITKEDFYTAFNSTLRTFR